MRIQCDVCEKEVASVFCAADEAALCGGCDRRVHHANKLAGKHLRFSLLHPSFTEAPRCDICQEKRAFLFCKEDRAILCRECDVSIHRANEHTKKHNRFLLTGVKLSSSSSLFPTTSYSSSGVDAVIKNSHRHTSGSGSGRISSSRSPEMQFPSNYVADETQISDSGSVSVSASSISEYLGTLPGWCVDDFFDPLTASNRFY